MMSCKMNSNREYIHGYCSPCKRFFNSFFLSPLSNCNRLARGRSHRHHQTTTNPTTKPSTTTKHRNLAQKKSQNQQKPKNQPNPKSIETPNIPNRYNSAQRQPHRPTGNPSEKPIWKIQQKPTWKTHRKTRWICPDLPLICRRSAPLGCCRSTTARLPPICHREVAADCCRSGFEIWVRKRV